MPFGVQTGFRRQALPKPEILFPFETAALTDGRLQP